MPEIIRCTNSQKPLAHIENGKLLLWCKQCKASHEVSVEELLRVMNAQEYQAKPAKA